MKSRLKRTISAVMSAVMLISSAAFVRAEEPSGTSYFDFEYGNYDVNENDGELKVKIVRYGSAAESADVAVKAADFLSTYGKDYEILDEDGNVLEKVSGVKPDPSDFVYDENESGAGLYVFPDEVASGDAIAVESAEESEPVDPSEPAEVNEFEGSHLLAAQAQYLDLPKAKDEKNELTPSDLQKSVDEMTKYFASAEGAEGIIHFKAGETEKEITVNVIDNSTPESDKMFMLAILGADGENVETKANATTYVSIIDDEEREDAAVSIDTKVITLTKDAPSAEVTIRRTSGLQYFTSVYVSTVNIDDCEGAYEEFVGKTVAFVPGETEKTVTVTAKEFKKNTSFGVKLEGLSDVKIGNSLATVYIGEAPKDEPVSVQEASEESPVEAQASGIYLGNAVSAVYAHDLNYNGSWWTWYGKPDGGWFHSGHAGSWMENGGVVVDEYGEDSYSYIYTKNNLDTVGITRYAVDCYRRADRGGYGVFETDSDQSWTGNINSAGRLQADYQRASVWLSNGHRNLYIKLGVTNHSNHERTEVKFDNLDNYWTKYTFEKVKSDFKAERKLYDFTTGDVMTTYFDGEKSKSVSIDGLNIKSDGGSDVAGFYADTGSTIVFTAPESVTKYGYVLDKVYFRNKAGNCVLTKTADANGVLKISAGQKFLGELYDKKVIALNYDEKVGDEGRSTIYVKPTYKIQTRQVSFWKNANFVNLDKSYGGIKKEDTNEWCRMWIPVNSVLRVQYSPNADRQPAGVKYNANNGWVDTYYSEGNEIYSTLPNQQKEKLTVTDYTKGEIVVPDRCSVLSITHNTKAQNLYLTYAPKLRESMKAQRGGSLSGAAVNADDTSDYPQKTDSNGSMVRSGVSMGSTYNFRSYAPQGYYTQWWDMTGDTNDDGVRFGAGDEPKTSRNYDNIEERNFRTVYGSMLNVKVSKDNTKYNYAFMPAVLSDTFAVTGTLNRRKASVLQLSRTRREEDIKTVTPISGTFVNIAEQSAMTDENGKFTVKMPMNVPTGAVSAYYTVDGVEYSTDAHIDAPNKFVVPALPQFEVVLNSVKANYSKDAYKIGDAASLVMVHDDSFTIDMTVEGSSTIKPNDAKFSVYDFNGNYLREANDSKLFTIKKEPVASRNQFKVSIKFNPKAALNSNEELYVRFADQNGNWYSTLSTGYMFMSELTLDKFIFPLIGSSTLESGVTGGIVEDIIGNPMGNMNVGEIKNPENDEPIIKTSSSDFMSAGLEQYIESHGGEAPQEVSDGIGFNKWSVSTYSFGFKKEFSGSKKYSSKEAKEKAEKEKEAAEKKKKELENNSQGWEIIEKPEEKEPEEYEGFEIIEKDTTEMPKDSGSGYNTESKFKWSLKPAVNFRLAISNRPTYKNGQFVDYKPYFEDLTFMVGLKFGVSTNNTISTPIGIDVIINASLDGTVAGVYHMWSDYKDDWQIEGATPYTSDDFGIFKKFGPDSAVRREAYIFLNPTVSVTLGISIKVAKLTGTAKFAFDMDFQFTDQEDEKGDMVINYYGDMTIKLGWAIEVLGFTVYKKEYPNVKTVEMFKQGTDKHINFGIADEMIKAMSADEMAAGADEPIQNDPVSRAYLKNRGGWNTSGAVQLLSSATTTETDLQKGSAANNEVKMIKINDNEILMLFIDDVPSRNNVNKRALYYSIGDGTTWSQPQVVNDDGTMDDYPTVTDLGDGRIFVAWSSANKAFESGATVEDALKSLEIQAAFFDKSSKTFGDVETLTKTTKEDYTADIYPHAVYDPTTNKLILYYTKTEYDRIETVGALSDAASVNAYMFYENGKWSNDGSAYTDEELTTNRMKQIAAANNMSLEDYQNYYRDQWYGQRFLDLRLSDSAELTRVAETTAMYYNGLGIFAWTNDWDNDLSTAFDRDVFVQIYDFERNIFTHIIRMTSETSGYFNPRLERSADAVVLFFGTIAEEDEMGEIDYFSITDIVANSKFEKVTDGGVNYYKLPEGLEASHAVKTKNVMDYDSSVDSKGQLYLFWTDSVKDGSLDIMTAMYREDGGEMTPWSEAVQLTDVDTNIYYMNLGAAIIDDMIYIGAGKSNYTNEADNHIVMLKHVPASDVVVDEISTDKEHFIAGEPVEVSAVIRNKDLLTENNKVDVVFTLNGSTVGTQTVDYAILGGSSTTVNVQAVMPENPVDVKFGAYISGSEPKEITVENGAYIQLSEHDFEYVDKGSYIYRFTASNNGGKPSESFNMIAEYGETEVDSYEVPSINSGESIRVEMPVTIDDDEFAAERDAAQLILTGKYGEDTISQMVEDVYNPYDWTAVDAIAKVTDIKFENSYDVEIGEGINIQPVINGVDENTLKVMWLSASDPIPAEIDAANGIYGDVVGKTILTGVLVPYENEFVFNSDGTAEAVDWRDRLPESSIVTVTAVVNVVESKENTTEQTTETATETTTSAARRSSGGGGGGGSSSSAASKSAEATTEAFVEATTADVIESGNTNVTEETPEITTVSARFIDIAGHWAESVIEKAADDGIVSGYEDNSFKPNKSITRAEFVAMLYNSGLADTEYPETLREFADVDYTEWYAKYLMWAVGNDIITGYDDNTFRGNDVISRQEMAVVISKFSTLMGKEFESGEPAVFNDAADIAAWAKPYVDDISAKSAVQGDNFGNFNPKKDLTRAETAVIITNIK